MLEKAPEKLIEEKLLYLKESPSNEYFFNKIEGDYLYWDKVKYVSATDTVQLWKEIKLIRSLISRTIFIKGKKHIELKYGVNDFLQQKLHYLDFNFGAGIQFLI